MMAICFIVALVVIGILMAVVINNDIEIHDLRRSEQTYRKDAAYQRERAETAERATVIARQRASDVADAIEHAVEDVKGLHRDV